MRRLTFFLAGLLTLAQLPFILHARALSHFVSQAERTPPPEALGLADKLWVLASGVRIPKPAHHTAPEDYGLRAEVVDITAGVRGWWIGPEDACAAVVLVHGYAGSADQLLPLVPDMRSRGFAALLIDLPGSGMSDGHVTTLGIGEADVVEAAAHFTRERADRVVLYGYSMGGAAVLRAGAHGVAADAIVVENTFGGFVDTVARRFELMGLPGRPLADLLVGWGSVQLGVNGFAHRPDAYAQRVSVPTWVLQGEGDARVPIGDARAIAAGLADGQLVTVPDGGHALAYYSDHAQWLAVLDDVAARARARSRCGASPASAR